MSAPGFLHPKFLCHSVSGEQGLSLAVGTSETAMWGLCKNNDKVLGCNPKKVISRDEEVFQAFGGKVSNHTDWLLSVAAFLAQLCDCTLVLGSLVPFFLWSAYIGAGWSQTGLYG